MSSPTVDIGYGFTKETVLGFDEALRKISDELAKEGFGVLTTIDVRETLKKKLNIDVPPHVILGACNPPFAHASLEIDPNLGLLLPCNVTVRVEEGRTVVGAFDPTAMTKLPVAGNLEPLAREVRSRLKRVIEAM